MGEIQEKKLTEDQQKFVDYLAIPATKRPKTQKAFAKELGVAEQTLAKWKKKPDLMEEVHNRKRQLVGIEDYSAIIDALVLKAKMGSYNHIKLVMEWLGEISSNQFPTQRKNNTNINLIFGKDIPRPGDAVDVTIEDGKGINND